MRSILVPLDGSALAEQVLPAAQVFASLLHARLHLLRAVREDDLEPLTTERAVLLQYGASLDVTVQRERAAVDQAHRHAEVYLSGQALRLQQAGFPTSAEVVGGEPAELIAECSAANGAALIAMSTHGHSGLRRWALGSVASKLVHATHVPIFLTRSGGQSLSPTHSLRRILVPLDGSSYARAALPLTLDLARRAGAEVVLCHVVAPLDVYAAGSFRATVAREHDRQHEAQKALADLASQCGSPDVAIRTVVTTGEASEEIARVAAWEQADVIAMATHGRSGVRRWTLGSVADNVLHTSNVPLLLVRPQTG
jgi:nucleotide-binding universal stress UspA family protein